MGREVPLRWVGGTKDRSEVGEVPLPPLHKVKTVKTIYSFELLKKNKKELLVNVFPKMEMGDPWAEAPLGGVCFLF